MNQPHILSLAYRAGTPIVRSCLICSAIAENDEVVAVEDFINVGNILTKSWVALYLISFIPVNR